MLGSLARLLTLVALVLTPLALPSATSVAAGPAWTPRAEQYPGTVTRTDLEIPMSDGVVLRGDLTLPAGADGVAVPGRWPVVVTITAYNKSAIGGALGGLAGGDSGYLVKRGYAQLTVDARGTGSSGGQWCAFCTRENTDAGEVMAWAASSDRPWSNGSTAMTGPSYMGISQLFAAAQQPPGLKAIFPQVPAGDVYRDVVASGGQLDVGFMPLWMGLVTATGVIPPAITATNPVVGLEVLALHLGALATFTLPTLLGAMAGAETAYDGDFYAQRSPLTVVDKVDVPTFLVAGEHDLFQRGTPLVFESLQRRGVPVKLVMGPWNHLQASAGEGLEEAGHGTLNELQLRWFDHYVKGMPDPALSRIAPITYYEQGTDQWRTAQRWVDQSDTEATELRLSGSAAPGRPGGLASSPGSDGVSTVLPLPVQGLCSRSTDQWTAGLASQPQLFNAGCFEDNRVNDLSATLFETAPLAEEMPFLGPFNARLFVGSPTGEGMLSVALSDVAPDGTVRRLTGGWQVISLRELDESRSRYLDGKLLQAFHPFTADSRQPAAPGQVVPVDVEIFPTGASIQPGHRLRLSVQAYDVPHLLPTLPQLPGLLSPLRIHSSAAYPSSLVLPTRTRKPVTTPPAPVRPAATAPPSAVATLPRPRLAVRVVDRRAVITAPGAAGRVRVLVDGRAVTTTRLERGRVAVRLPRVREGRHVLRVVYLGSPQWARTSVTRVWRVR